ncbi:MAG: chemotaxis response regulator protein-glutamate methylesterase [Spirochaetota bacterium]
MNKIKVLVVDDSAVMRKTLTDILNGSSKIEVVGTALDPYIAVNKIKQLNPDVLTLDIEMPRMDGLTFLRKLMLANPMPVIMVSAFTDKGALQTIQALEYGAVDFILKPRSDDSAEWDRFANELREKVITAASIQSDRFTARSRERAIEVEEKFSADIILPKTVAKVRTTHSDVIIALGASTGGTEVIAKILSNLHENVPAIAIVQHMPEKFTEAFANRVNNNSKLYVKEAQNGDRLYRGTALVAPGNRHMLVRSDANGYYVEINDGPPVNRHKPSVDVLFRSVAQNVSKSVGILCTGMGADGAEGLGEILQAGGVTIAQDEASSVVFGMPREAIKRGAAQKVLNIEQMIAYINNL